MQTGLVAIALTAGAVAAFNPCGFAMLPAYLAMLVTGDDGAPAAGPTSQTLVAAVRAVSFASAMTLGFVGVFGAFGVFVASFAVSVERYLPVVTVVIGAALVLAGGWLLAGRSLAFPGMGGHGKGPTTTWFSQVGYGLSFALASLSCTVGPFLAVTSASLNTGGPGSVVAVFVLYALGMGSVVLVLACVTAVAGASLTTRLRGAGRVIDRVSGALLVVAGAYVGWYGWFELKILADSATQDPVVAAATRIQSAVTRAVIDVGVAPFAMVAAAVLVGLLVLRLRQRQRTAEMDHTQ